MAGRKRIGKKGSAIDILMIAVILLVIAVTTIIVFKVYHEVDSRFQADDVINTRGKTSSSQIRGMFPGVLDNSFLLLMVGLSIMAFILAALVRVHPMFFVFYIIVLTIIIFLAGVFSNIYTKIASQPELSALADELLFISHIMRYLPFIIGVMGTILAIVMYKLYSDAQGAF